MNEEHPRHRSDCPVCGGRDLRPSVLLDSIPLLCNELHCDAAGARHAGTGPFAMVFCSKCGHVFNAAFDEGRIRYSQSYQNSLHYSARFEEFSADLAERLHKTYRLTGKTVVEVGCGKGDFLKRLCALSHADGIGFDKSYEDHRGEGESGPNVRFINDWFSDAYPEIKPDLVCCRHVLEHIAEPIDFLRTLREHPGVNENTVFYFEVPNALYTLRDLGIWDLIYEHVSYFTPLSLLTAFERAGFEVLKADTAFGGQYLYVEVRPSGKQVDEQLSSVDEIAQLMTNFQEVYRAKLDHWQRYLANTDTRSVAVWGAGSKGVTFVNIVPGGESIGALVDVNPHKQGRFAPGSATPVIAPEALRHRQIKSIIIMNSIYRGEILRQTSELGLAVDIVTA